MRPGLEILLTSLHGAIPPEGFQPVAQRLRDHLAVRHAAFHWVNGAGQHFGATTYPDAWQNHYRKNGYFRTDPVMTMCFQRVVPMNWRRLDWTRKTARKFRQETLDHGLGNQGYSIPIRGPNGRFAMLTLNDMADNDTWDGFIALNARDLMIVAQEFFQTTLEHEQADTTPHFPPLSPREVSVMTCLAQGMNRAQAAVELQISEHTLRVYIEAARRKLGALNTTHAVARALSDGIIMV